MAERADIFDRDDVFTGITIDKHAPMEKGMYKRHAVIIMKAEEGYIMQQRSLLARYCPGEWDVTGGGVMAGETPLQAACREAFEEVGVEIEPEDAFLAHKEIMYWGEDLGAHLYVFGAKVKLPGGGVKFDPREVNDAKVVPFEEFYGKVGYNKTGEFMAALREIDRKI